MMSKPKIKIPKEPIDRFIETTGIIALLILFGLPIYYLSDLPEIIPIHFNAKGIPDSFKGKNMIWLLPILGGVLYIVVFYVNKFPHLFNYPQKITADNAPHYYKIASRMNRVLNSFVACIFAYMTFSIIQTALSQTNGLGPYFIYLVVGLMLAILIYFTFQLMRKV